VEEGYGPWLRQQFLKSEWIFLLKEHYLLNLNFVFWDLESLSLLKEASVLMFHGG